MTQKNSLFFRENPDRQIVSQFSRKYCCPNSNPLPLDDTPYARYIVCRNQFLIPLQKKFLSQISHAHSSFHVPYLLFKKSYRAKTLLSICFGGTGSVSRDFSPPFFHDSNPSGALTNMLKLFCIFFRFGQNIRSQSYKIVFNTGVTGRYRTDSLI